VRIPRLTTQKELDEPYASFNQPSGDQASTGVFMRGWVVQAIHAPDVHGLLRKIERLRHGRLHGGGNLEVGDARVELGMTRMAIPVRLVELIEKAKLALTGLGRHSLRRLQIEHRRGARAKRRSLADRRQPAARPVTNSVDRQTAGVR